MRRVAISNHKGGSGKTTSAVNLAAALAEAGKRVLVIDLDPQAQASAWLGVRDGGRGLLDLLEGNADVVNLVEPGNVAGVEVVPSSAWLSGADKALAGEGEIVKSCGLRELVTRRPSCPRAPI
ncbi:MAG: ParA family protein [Candidatus Dormibacteria bacterium]